MTTTANKHGLRKAASERTSRHAQRTSLPPKVGVTEEARENLRETQIRAAQEKALKRRQAEDAAPVPNALPAHVTKAKAFADFCRQHGWDVTTGLEGDLAEVQARRGTEAIHQAWQNGVYHPASATYTVGDRTVMTRNVAAAKRYAERAPEEADRELNRVASNKSFRRRETTPTKMRLPFDPATATDREVVDALAGKGVAWHNRFRQSPETAQTPRDPRRMRIEEQNGERVVLFCCPVTGFRAFRLSALTRVGRAKHPTKGQQMAEVTVE